MPPPNRRPTESSSPFTTPPPNTLPQFHAQQAGTDHAPTSDGAADHLNSRNSSAALQPSTEAALLLVAAAAVRLPAFFKDNPTGWFRSIESSFRLKNIKSAITKFDYAVKRLDRETMAAVQELVDQDPDEYSYNALKSALIDIYDPTPKQRLKEALGPFTLGDKRVQILQRN